MGNVSELRYSYCPRHGASHIIAVAADGRILPCGTTGTVRDDEPLPSLYDPGYTAD